MGSQVHNDGHLMFVLDCDTICCDVPAAKHKRISHYKTFLTKRQ
jgi:hypothetical protein